jgi:hypothetical protein
MLVFEKAVPEYHYDFITTLKFRCCRYCENIFVNRPLFRFFHLIPWLHCVMMVWYI